MKGSMGQVLNLDFGRKRGAVKDKADFLATGDKKDFAKLKARGSYPSRVVSPLEFIDIIFPEILKDIWR